MLSRDLNALEASQREAARVARGILEGKQGICEGCRALKGLAYDVVPDWVADPDFVVVGALDSDSDRFPLGQVRDRWDPTALAALDLERQEMERRAEPDVLVACRSIVARFGAA